MTRSIAFAFESRARRLALAALALCGLCLLSAAPARACSVAYGSDAKTVTAGYASNPYLANPTFAETGANSYLFLVMTVANATPGTATVTYNSQPMVLLGSAEETGSNSTYFWVYYQANPSISGGGLSISFSAGDNFGWGYETFSYGNAALGNSKFNSNAFSLSSGGTASPNLSFTLLNNAATVIEGLGWASGWGDIPSSFSLSPGSVIFTPSQSSMSISEEAGFTFGSASGFSTSAVSCTETLADSGQTGGVSIGIELDPACGSANSPTDTPTNTPVSAATATRTASPTPYQSPTKTPAVSPTYTPTPSLHSPTYTLTATRSPSFTPTNNATSTPTPTPGSSTGTCSTNQAIYGGTNYFQTSWEPGYWTPGNLNLTYYGTGASAGGTGANAASAGSLLLVFFIDQTVTSQCVIQTYGGQTMNYLAGPVIQPNNNAGDPAYSWWAYYLQNPPSSNASLYINYDSTPPNNGSLYAFAIDYGNVASSGGPIGSYSIGTSPFMGSTNGNVGSVSQNLGITPQNAESVFLYMLPMLGSGWGYTQNNISNAACDVSFSPITAYTNATHGGWSGCSSCFDPLLTDPITGTYGAGNLDLTLGQYLPCTSTPFVLNGGFNSGGNYQDYGLLWYIEILGNGQGSTNTSYGTCGVGAVPTPTDTPTTDPTATPVIVYQGLPNDMRPYGLEYVPFPTVTTSVGDQFYPLYETFSAEASLCPKPPCSSGSGSALVNAYGAPVNTARWHLVLTNLNGTVKVETRIGPNGTSCLSGVYDTSVYETYTALSLPTDPQNDSNAYFWVGDTYTASAVATVAGGGVPYTERFDAVGDPRFVPYSDELDFSGNPSSDGLGGGYNWFWRNFTSPSDNYYDEAQNPFYQPYLLSATYDGYASGGPTYTTADPNYDIPKLYSLIRNGVMASNAMYTSLTGFSSYYAALGGEIGGDNNSGFKNGVPCFGGPWGQSTTPYYVDEVVGNPGSGNNTNGTSYTNTGNINTPDGASLVVTGTSATAIGWASLPFLGELWPDGLYNSDWYSGSPINSSWGNLRNLKTTGGFALRVDMNSNELPLGASGTAGTFFRPTLHQAGSIGSASFFNGSNAGGDYFGHILAGTGSSAAAEQNDGTQAGQAYNVPLATDYYGINSPWTENLGSEPPEWDDPNHPYSGESTHLDVYAAATYTAGGMNSAEDWGYYSSNASGSSDPTTQKGAAAIRAIDANLTLTTTTGNAAGGWFIVDGLASETSTGGSFLSQFALAESLRTFADAGVPTNGACSISPSFVNDNNTYSGALPDVNGKTYRIPPIPLVTVLSPTASSLTQGLTTIPIQWDLRYARWDGNLYDENYPCVDANTGPCTSGDLIPNPALEWHDPQPVAFNIIYSVPSGLHPSLWYSAFTNQSVTAGAANNYVSGTAGCYMSDAADAILTNGTLPTGVTQQSTYQYTYNWSNVAPANYLVRVECFRLPSASSTTAYPHYGYDQISVNTEP